MARAAQIEHTGETVALNVAQVVSPFKKHGRLSVRIERAPQTARLSAGTRNSDGSWSLASDELDGLTLQLAEPLKKELKIGVRVIALTNGSTLTTLELPIKPGEEAAAAARPTLPTAAAGDSAETAALRQELAQAREALATRDAELAERLAAAAAEAATQFQQTLSKAEAAWTKSENARLAAVQQQWQDKFAEALGEIEAAQSNDSDAKLRELQEKLDTLQGELDERNAALARANDASEAARAEGNTVAQDAQAKLTALQAKLTEKETALVRAQAATDAVKREFEATFAKAEQSWRDAEDCRLAEAEAHWRETSAKALTDAQADTESLRLQGTESERDLLNRVTELQAAVAERDDALARAHLVGEQVRTRAAQEADARLAKAEQNWKAAEAARTVAAETEWKAKLAEAAKAASAGNATTPRANDAELRELREKLASVQARLATRDAAATRATKLAEEERMRYQKEAQEVIVKAARERKADEATRLAAAQAEWSKSSARELALISARAEAAEAALAQVRMRAKNDTQLQTELAATRNALAIREAELAKLHREIDGQPADEPAAVEEKKNAKRDTTVRDVLVAGCLGVVAVFLWPSLSAMIFGAPHKPVPKVVEAEAVAPALPVATVLKDAKLRAEGASSAGVIGKLHRDAMVEIVETKGDWTHVRVLQPAKGEKADGWTKSSVLQAEPEAADAAAKKPAPKQTPR